jgi:outer membrane lipoprotein-sorting protein
MSAFLVALHLLSSLPFLSVASHVFDTPTLLKNMEGAYSAVNDYQSNMEIRTYRRNGSSETRKFLYTFKKPKRIRIDFESPDKGMILVYPDKDGKVAVHRLFTIHLSPDSSLLRVQAGQRIDQTDLGLLITNISRSLTDPLLGSVRLSEENGNINIRVLADDHFRKGVTTLYRFTIDKKLWLPVKVEEYTPGGVLERSISFHNLRTNVGFPDTFFELHGGSG